VSVDVVTLGEALLRLSVVSGSRFSEMSELRVSVGGAESNVAVALAQMGCSVAWLSAVPDNHFGRYVLKDLARHGVDTQFVVTEPNARIGLYFVEPGSTPRPDRVIYDRKNSAVTRLQSSDVPWGEVESAKAAHITGITPALSESLRMLAIEFTKRARSAGVPVCVDVNYRAHLWGIEEARPVLLELCREATLVILTEEDARGVFGFVFPFGRCFRACLWDGVCGTYRIGQKTLRRGPFRRRAGNRAGGRSSGAGSQSDPGAALWLT